MYLFITTVMISNIIHNKNKCIIEVYLCRSKVYIENIPIYFTSINSRSILKAFCSV